MPDLRLTYDEPESADPLAPIPFPMEAGEAGADRLGRVSDSSSEALRLASELEDAIDVLQDELDRVSETLASAFPFPDDGDPLNWPPPAA